MAKDRNINVRLGAEDVFRLDGLCEHYALSLSSVVRMLVKEKFDALSATRPLPLQKADRILATAKLPPYQPPAIPRPKSPLDAKKKR